MIIDFDSMPIINEQQLIYDYYSHFNYEENPREWLYFHVNILEDGIGGCSGEDELICEYYSYEYLDEQDRQMKEAEEQQKQKELDEKQKYEIQYAVHEVTDDKGFTYWINDDGRFCYPDGKLVPEYDMAHLGLGIGTYPSYVLQ